MRSCAEKGRSYHHETQCHPKPSAKAGTSPRGGGNVYLINPHGVLFGATASVNVGSLYVSTKTLTNDELAAFAANGASPLTGVAVDGDIVNQGATLKAMNIVLEADGVPFRRVLLDTQSVGGIEGKCQFHAIISRSS